MCTYLYNSFRCFSDRRLDLAQLDGGALLLQLCPAHQQKQQQDTPTPHPHTTTSSSDRRPPVQDEVLYDTLCPFVTSGRLTAPNPWFYLVPGTLPSLGTVSPLRTLLSLGTVSPLRTLLSLGTVSPLRTLLSLGTVSPLKTLPSLGTFSSRAPAVLGDI
jgi:hypothetical protein